MSKIEPALTAEEWAELRVAPDSAGCLAIHDDGDGIEVIVYPDRVARDARRDLISKHKLARWDTRAVHAAAALCLHGQPFGFTREDVGLLRTAANDRAVSQAEEDAYRCLADRIEALLPPEES